MQDDRIISGFERQGDERVDTALRPKTLDQYVGQEKVKEKMRIFMGAAKKRGEALDHVLLYGPPGLGKTTLAAIIANEMGVNFRYTTGPAIERQGDLAALLTGLNEGDVLFIDEIHRLNATVEEFLYPAMEDYALDIIVGKGPMANSLRIELKPFTLVGATTRAGMLTAPLRDRFGVQNRMEMYTIEELDNIIKRSASIMEVPIEPEGAMEIATRSRGTPRVANRLLRRVRDFAQIKAAGIITEQVAKDAMILLEVDALGLDTGDRRILDAIINKFAGGPVGIDTLGAATGEDSGTIEDVYEPYLMQLGYVMRTPRGRVATKLAYDHMGLKYDTQKQPSAQDFLEGFNEDE